MSRYEGYETFYKEAFARVLFRALCITGNKELAWDVAQEAMLVMLEKWDQRRARTFDDNLRYAAGVAGKQALSARRRIAVQVKALVQLGGRRETSAAPFDVEVEFAHDLMAALEGMSVQERAVAVLSASGMSTGDVADALRITQSTVRSHKQRIRRGLHLPSVVLALGEGDA
ncbi:sigma-70 family RNA polymerase sigma factor [Dactylosporangium sp. NPDC050588]|uniref:RNA polymerase sigma factor n=1 Tax=Dactylosporangium sp. NPDC050588 TaxID=3157211 RepID=UPI0034031B4D